MHQELEFFQAIDIHTFPVEIIEKKASWIVSLGKKNRFPDPLPGWIYHS